MVSYELAYASISQLKIKGMNESWNDFRLPYLSANTPTMSNPTGQMSVGTLAKNKNKLLEHKILRIWFHRM